MIEHDADRADGGLDRLDESGGLDAERPVGPDRADLFLRARGLQTWEDMEPVVEQASSSMPPYAVHEHNGDWFIQSASAARRVAKRLALMLSQPIPAWGDVEMLDPDLSIRLGDTVVTTFPGVPAKQRVCGIRLHMGEGTGLTQTLTTRQLHP